MNDWLGRSPYIMIAICSKTIHTFHKQTVFEGFEVVQLLINSVHEISQRCALYTLCRRCIWLNEYLHGERADQSL